MSNDFLQDLVDHKQRVAKYLLFIANALAERAAIHDNSKFTEEEFKTYEAAFSEFKTCAYGTEEYREVVEKIKPAIKHHYQANDHHPEHFQNGINDMDLVQIVEMVCDWMAASERSQTDIFKGLEINQERFGIDSQLMGVISHTIAELKAK